MSRGGRAVLAAGIVVAVAGLTTARYLAGTPDDPSAPRVVRSADAHPEHDYVIPAGTADRIAAGERVEVVPGEIRARVGDAIRIVNRDRVAHALGPWFVGPGEVVSQRFASPGTLEGACNVHRSGQLRVVVGP